MKLRGVVPVMLLPLLDDEGIDEVTFRREVDFAIDAGAAAVCAPGFATEFYKLTDPERYRIAQLLVEQTAGRTPTIVSTGAGSVHATVEFSRYAESIGADCLMVTAPKWCSLGLQEMATFYESICRSVRIPVMIQDADFTGTGLPAKLFVQLAECCPNLEFAKLEIVLPGWKATEIIRLSEGKLQVLYGLGGVALMDGLAHGAVGVMPGSALIEIYARIFQLFDQGRFNEAKTLFYRLQPYLIFALQHLELAVQIEKRVLKRRGVFPTDRTREPTLHLDQAYQIQMDELVEDMVQACEEVRAVQAEVRKAGVATQ
jgi:4-hydroxy-tetrahydrodipicolinate synthase